MNMFSEMWAILVELFALMAEIAGGEKWPNYFPLKSALGKPGAWLLGVVIVVGGGLLVLQLYRVRNWFDDAFAEDTGALIRRIILGLLGLLILNIILFGGIADAKEAQGLTAVLQPIAKILTSGIVFWVLFFPAIIAAVAMYANNLERILMIITYLSMAGIICASVLREWVFDGLAVDGLNGELNWFLTPIYEFLNAYPLSWATTLPPLLFMVLVWFACSYNVRTRSHLAFSEFRQNFPRPIQMATLTLDLALWLSFAVIVIVGGLKLVLNDVSNERPVDGTDFKMMLWWFNILVPASFVLLSGRCLEVWFEDIKKFKNGDALVGTFAIGGDD